MKQQQVSSSLPISYEAERAVLVALLTNKRATLEILSAVTPDDFTNPDHKTVLRIVAHLFEKQQPVDMVTVSIEFRKDNHIKSKFSIADLFKDDVFTGNYQAHITMIKDFSRRRRILLALQDGAEKISGLGNVDETISELVTSLQLSDDPTKRPVSMEKVVSLSQKRIELALSRKSHVTGIPTGFTKFDEQMGGLQRGELILIGARPSIGKSAMLACLAMGAARRGYTSLIVNAEMMLVDVGTRMLAKESGISNIDLRRGLLNDDDIPRVISAASRLYPLPIWIYDDARWEIIKTQIRAFKAYRKDLSLVLIDYVQRIKANTEKGELRYQTIGRIAREAKDLAKELEVPVVMAAQIDRSVSKEGKEPELSDLRESGDLENEADVVSFLHCYKPKTDIGSQYWIIKKNRNGPLGSIHLEFVGNDVAYYDWKEIFA